MAVVAFYADRDGKTKHTKCQRNGHAHHLLSEMMVNACTVAVLLFLTLASISIVPNPECTVNTINRMHGNKILMLIYPK